MILVNGNAPQWSCDDWAMEFGVKSWKRWSGNGFAMRGNYYLIKRLLLLACGGRAQVITSKGSM